MDENKSYWDKEEFEDLLIKGIISLYEKRISIHKYKCYPFNVSEKEIKQIKNFGLYFAPDDRISLPFEIDTNLIKSGCISFTNHCPVTSSIRNINKSDLYAMQLQGYMNHIYFRKAHDKLKPEFQYPSIAGTLYDIFYLMMMDDDGLIAMKGYAWVAKDGYVHPLCWKQKRGLDQNYLLKERIQDADMLSRAHGLYDDRRFLWNVRAEEKEARVTFGVYPEQIKSLFYARQNPLSSTGRRRPILHWVASHRRRLKEGIEIDIEKHLRGVTEFEMEGTKFSITRPIKIAATQNNNEIEALHRKVCQMERDRILP